MKNILLSLCGLVLLGSCQNFCKFSTVQLKECNAKKTIAFPSTPEMVTVRASYDAGLIGMLMSDGTVNPNSFINKFKEALRSRGWKIVVSGVTGRSGENASINSGAAFTIIGAESKHAVNFSVIENKTGEEVLLIRGCIWWARTKKAHESADALEELIE